MAINLELVFFSGQIVTGNKKLKLSFPNEKHYNKSINLTVPEPLLIVQKVELKGNLFTTATFVRLMKSAFKDVADIKEKLELASRKDVINSLNQKLK